MVIKQILRDLRKEWSWAFFYAVVATMIAMAILYLSVTFSSVQRQSAAIRSFVDQNVIMFQLKTVQMETNREATLLSNESKQDPADIMDYLQRNLSKEGNAGSFVFVGNDGYVDSKYEQILILFGKYSDLSGLHYDGSMALFVPEAHKEDVGKEFLISGQNLKSVDSAGSKYSLFHPLHFIDSDDLMLSNTLILCTRDFQTVNGMFPWWGLSSEVFGRMVLVDPYDKEVDQLQITKSKERLLMELLSVQNVSKSFKDHSYTVHAVNDVSLDIHQGEMIAIIGPSGSGKTTLLNLMGIVISPDSGEVYVEGQKASRMNDTMRCRMRNQYFGYIVQDFALIEEDTAMQKILVPTLYSKHKKSSSEYRKLIYSMAEKLQVSDKLKSTVKKLSGGERQRIAIIRSMVCDQKIILADEPTGSLDKDNSTIVMKCLRELVDDSKKTVVIVTHDLDVARQCDRTFDLTGGVLTPCNLHCNQRRHSMNEEKYNVKKDLCRHCKICTSGNGNHSMSTSGF